MTAYAQIQSKQTRRRLVMKWIAVFLAVVIAVVCVVAAQAPRSQVTDAAATAIDAGKLPAGYRDWRLISVAREEGTLDDIRAILGNDVAGKGDPGQAPPLSAGTNLPPLPLG